ncbi:MAG: SUMF1/EgtB/PvdO family nonheme iron enzyme [Candidatus Sumerlaeota bacterium]|nr:SUMF1/EgtB/PvdO family nonheme iron enzyme [Candidatus Sumerlaeota bacterium]
MKGGRRAHAILEFLIFFGVMLALSAHHVCAVPDVKTYSPMALNNSVVPGDINNDGAVDSSDAQMLLEYLSKKRALDAAALARADGNLDGMVNAADLLYIVDHPYKPQRLIETVVVAGGAFTMGRRDDGDDGSYGDPTAEVPRHSVTLSTYRIGKYMTTNGQFCAVLNWAKNRGYLKNSSNTAYNSGDVYVSHQRLIAISDPNCQIQYSAGAFSSKNRLGTGGASYSMQDFPVISVTWYGAVAFCNWLSEKENLTICYSLAIWELRDADPNTPGIQFHNGYRLPTEAEWERAAAWDGTKHWIYGFAGDTLSGKRRCNYYDSNPDDVNPAGMQGRPYTSPVGWFNGVHVSPNGSIATQDSPSPAGCYDMSGNVWEWCQDWYEYDYYWLGAMTNPTGPATGIWTHRVARGGGWYTNFQDCRTAFRNNFAPDEQNYYLGFRVASAATAQ